MIGLVHDGPHVALVVLARAVDVEVFQADDLLEQVLPERPKVEQLLRVAVHVQRLERPRAVVGIRVTERPVAVRRPAGGVDQPDVVVQTPLAQLAGEAVVVVDEEARILLGRRTARAQVENRIHLAERIVPEMEPEVVFLPIVGEMEPAEVLPLLIRRQFVHDQDVVLAALVQRRDNVAADETRTARHDEF